MDKRLSQRGWRSSARRDGRKFGEDVVADLGRMSMKN
jgi:hypothetical protein